MKKMNIGEASDDEDLKEVDSDGRAIASFLHIPELSGKPTIKIDPIWLQLGGRTNC